MRQINEENDSSQYMKRNGVSLVAFSTSRMSCLNTKATCNSKKLSEKRGTC